jgi:hypothetical protein
LKSKFDKLISPRDLFHIDLLTDPCIITWALGSRDSYKSAFYKDMAMIEGEKVERRSRQRKIANE